MKVLLINGSPRKNGNTAAALSAIEKELAAQQIETVSIQVGNQAIRGCMACGGCRRTSGGLCVFTEDPVNECVRLMAECDGLVIGSPVYYSGIAGTMKSFLDRFFYCGGGQLCAYKPVAGVVALRRSGGVDAFHQMNNYFNLANALIVPSFYWNAIHGMRPGEAQQDMEGIQIMENIGRNMAWMLKTLEYSRAAVPLPENIRVLPRILFGKMYLKGALLSGSALFR